jgi:hypothetical protein
MGLGGALMAATTLGAVGSEGNHVWLPNPHSLMKPKLRRS